LITIAPQNLRTQVQARYAYVPMPRYLVDHCTSVSDVAYRQRLRSASSHDSWSLCSTSPAQCPWTSGICRCWECWPDCLELFPRGHAGIQRFL